MGGRQHHRRRDLRVLKGELTSQEAMQVAEQRVGALGNPD